MRRALTTAGLDQVTMAAIRKPTSSTRKSAKALAAGARFILILGARASAWATMRPKSSARCRSRSPSPSRSRARGLTNTLSRPVPRGRQRDRARLLGALIISSPRLAWQRARHPRVVRLLPAIFPPARRAALTLPSNKKRGLGSLVSRDGSETWPGFEIPILRAVGSRDVRSQAKNRGPPPGHRKRTEPRFSTASSG